MMNFFRKHMRMIFIVTIVAFLGGIIFGVVAYLFNKPMDFAAKVNGVKIPMKLFYSIYTNSVKTYEQVENKVLDDSGLNELKVMVLNALIQNELLSQEAKKHNIVVSDEELSIDIHNTLELKEGNVFSMQKYKRLLHALQMKPSDYENFRRKQLLADKVKMAIASRVKLLSCEIETTDKQNPPTSKDDLLLRKMNTTLIEWYSNAITHSKIIKNDNL